MTVTKCQAEEAAEYWVSRKAVSRVSHSERSVSRYIDYFKDDRVVSKWLYSIIFSYCYGIIDYTYA